MQRRRTTDDPHCGLVSQDSRGAHYGSLSEEAIAMPQVGGCSPSPSDGAAWGITVHIAPCALLPAQRHSLGPEEHS